MSETTDITTERADDEQVVEQHGEPHEVTPSDAEQADVEQADVEQADGDEVEASSQEPQDQQESRDETPAESTDGDDAGQTSSDTDQPAGGGQRLADDGQQDEAPPQAPRRASRSRRATRPTSAPEPDAPGDPVVASAAPDGSAPDSPAPSRLDVLAELGASAERAPAAKPAVSGDASAALGSIVFESPARRAGAKEAAPTARDEIAPADAGAGNARPDDGDGPRLPVTALLFQAPDLTSAASRSRRAQAPAGPPAFGFEEGEPEEQSRGQQRRRRPGAPEGSGNQDATGSADEETDEETSDDESSDESTATSSAGQRRRRRRGGRGRRSRPGGQSEGSGADDEDDEEDDESTTDTPDAAEDGGDQEESSDRDAESGQGTPGPSRGQRRRRGRGQRDQGAGSAGEDNVGEQNADAEAGPADGGAAGDGNDAESSDESGSSSSSSRRRRRRRRGSRSEGAEALGSDSPNDEVTALKGSTRLEAKRQRRREGRDAGRRRTVVTEAEFLARRESVDRSMVVRERDGRTQIAVLEDDVLVEHFVARRTQTSMVGNVYLGRVQNVLPSMEAAFVDLGKGRNAVLYAGEVNWDAAGMEGQPRRIEQALSSGDAVMVQVTKDPIGHKGARLTSQITLAGRYLVLVPSGGMTGISRKLPDTERARLKKLLREIVPDGAGVIVRTAAEGASEEELRLDVARLQVQWAEIERKAKSAPAPSLLHGEPDLAIRVVRDVFNEDFASVTISGDEAWDAIAGYIESIAPDLAPRLHRWTSQEDVFHAHRIDEQLTKALDRKVWLPSGGSLVIDRTEAMTVVDVNTGKFVGAGGTLEETVTRNNLEAAEEIVRQLRLRDIGGIIVIDFIDMVLESNRDLVLRRLVECLGRDRTRHQVAEVTSLGLVQMTRKRVGMGLLEAFTEPCEACGGRGHHVRSEPVEKASRPADPTPEESGRSDSRRRGRRGGDGAQAQPANAGGRAASAAPAADDAAREAVKAKLATIAAAAAHAHDEHEQGVQPDSELAAMAAGADSGDEPEIAIDFDRIRSSESDAPDAPATEEPAAIVQGDGEPVLEERAHDEQAEPEQAEPEQAEPEQAEPEQAEPEQAEPEQARHEGHESPQVEQREHEHASGQQHG